MNTPLQPEFLFLSQMNHQQDLLNDFVKFPGVAETRLSRYFLQFAKFPSNQIRYVYFMLITKYRNQEKATKLLCDYILIHKLHQTAETWISCRTSYLQKRLGVYVNWYYDFGLMAIMVHGTAENLCN